jgi:hypothetical protein
MKEVILEAERRKIELNLLRTAEAIETLRLRRAKENTNAILGVTS